ncbi:MAG: B12-binding domain-containing radical SAM protein [Bacteroidales bacterium]|jgi:radical SAM superfamily enzyme YgiQ (UPF0313 family)|nr:B12-binding domain-containing radical SAM protein [Bacteroidales bacterium]
MIKNNLTIKLISPRMSLRPMDSEMKRRMAPPLSLVTIASLTPEQHYVYIEDENVGKINFDDNPDLVGITVNIDTVYRAFEISAKYRQKGAKVIFGGIYVSACPQEVAGYCDSVCIGEAENLWEQIINDYCNDDLKAQYFNPVPVDLSLVPVANWDYIKQKEKYLYNNIIVTSRGCPFKCEFCYNSCDYVSGKYRNRPVENIITEIKKIGKKHIMFIDDNFIGNIDWTKSLIKQIKDMGLIWHAAVSTNIVHHPELIIKMAESGCRSLFIGFESINDNSILNVNKKQNKVSEYERLIKLLHDNGIMVNASLVFGFDNDTPETFDKTLAWLIRNRVETMTGHILTPYPGTILYRRFEKDKRVFCHDLEKYNTAHAVFNPVYFAPEQLEAEYRKIYKDFYSFRNILKRRPENKRIRASYFLFNFGYRKYGQFISFFGRIGLMNSIGKLARRLSYGI